MAGKQKRERESQDAQDALIKQLWEQGKDDAYIAERVFKHASFAAFVFRRRHEKGWIHKQEGKS